MDHTQELGKTTVSQKQIDRLLRGQQKLEHLVEEIRRSVDKLPAWILNNLAVTVTEVQGLQSGDVTGHLAKGSSSKGYDSDEEPTDSQETQPFSDTVPVAPAAKMLPRRGSVASIVIGPAAQTSEVALAISGMDSSMGFNKFGENASTEKRKTASSVLKVHDEFHDVEMNHASSQYFHIRQMLEEEADAQKRPRATAQFSDGFALNKWAPSNMVLSGPQKGCAIHPASRFCTALTVIRAAFLALDAVMVPYVMAWNVGVDQDWALYFRWLIVGFWTADLLLNFATGYIQNDSVVMRLSSIAKRYVRKGFAIDLIVVLIDYVDLYISMSAADTEAGGGSLQAVKALRFFKITRLVRIVAKLRTGLLERLHAAVLYWLQAHQMVEYQPAVSFAAVIIKLIFVIIWLGHVGACIYYALERSLAGDGVESWSDYARNSPTPPYVNALYWSVSTMFSGASIQEPLNNQETFLSMVWLLMGALFVTMITSTLAATLIDSQEKQQEMNKKARCLTTYLGQRKTPILLSIAINADFHHKVMSPKPLTELDLSPFLQVISPGLRAALREFEYAQSLLCMPLLRMLSVLGKDMIKELAFGSTVRVARDGEEIFAAKQEAEHTMLLSKGAATYSYSFASRTQAAQYSSFAARSSANLDAGWGGKSEKVQPGTWICELTLVSTWTTLGQLESNSQSELLFLSSSHFIKVVTADPTTEAVIAHYAVKLSEIFRDSDAVSMFTDLNPAVDCDTVAVQMHTSVRGLVSLPVLDMVRRQQNLLIDFFRQSSMTALEDEILAGQCHLVMGSDGPQSILRVVRLVALEIMNPDGYTCVQLIERKGGSIVPKFCLPGTKLRGDEGPKEAAGRLMTDKLKLLAPAIRIVGERRVVEYDTSATFGLRTKYIKIILMADFLGHLEADTLAVSLAATKMRSEIPVVMNSTSSSASATAPGASRVLRSFRVTRHLKWPQHSESVQSMFSRPPFDTDGPTHAFSMRRLTTAAVRFGSESDAGETTPPPVPPGGGGIAAVASNDITQLGSEAVSLRATGTVAAPAASEDAMDVFKTINGGAPVSVFRWMPPDEFLTLSWRKAEVEAELSSQAAALPMWQWHRLLAWKLKCGVSL